MLNQINLSSTWISSSRIHAFQMRLKYGKQSRVFGGFVPPWPPHRATGGGREGGREDQGVRTAHTLWVRSRFTARDRKSTATLSHRQAISSPTEAEKGRFGCDENARIHNGDEMQNSSERTKVPVNHCGGADSGRQANLTPQC